MKIAVLSNVNMNAVIRILGKETKIYQAEGYGNELGVLMNPESSYHEFSPEYTFLIMDLMELLEHDLDAVNAGERVQSWFASLESILSPDVVYYISDAYLWGPDLDIIHDPGRKTVLEGIWQEHLEKLCAARSNVRILPYRRLVEGLGEENAFSLKMWYMGKILLSNEAQKRLCMVILDKLRVEIGTPKKVLVLDLDNTLWGGLAGENEDTPVVLSEEHAGLAYKNLQRVILQMQRQGVVLAIVSKNNEDDVTDILECHPHMVLRPEDFAAKRINWVAKHENMISIAEELNLGLDSFVFWDDSPQERQLIKGLLPQVEVPDFPDRAEELADAMVGVYRKYFAKAAVTDEDLAKTRQYADNAARLKMQESAGSFESYLRNLEIVATRVDPQRHVERLTQMMNKTNQFNLTTKRYTQSQVEQLVRDEKKQVYLYNVSDRFGDSGIVAVLVVDFTGLVPIIEEFAMSCRVMGKNIEHALVEDVERDLQKRGHTQLRGRYLPTAKNHPVKDLYSQLGYEKLENAIEDGEEFEIQLEKKPKRMYYVEIREAL